MSFVEGYWWVDRNVKSDRGADVGGVLRLVSTTSGGADSGRDDSVGTASCGAWVGSWLSLVCMTGEELRALLSSSASSSLSLAGCVEFVG